MSLFGKKSIVGLDLGHHTLKAVQIERGGGTWKVARLATAPTPPDTIKDGVVTDPETLGLAIKAMLRDAHIGANAAVIAAAGGAVFVRPVAFPKMSEATLRKSIKFEASRYVPGSVDDSFIEFEILGPIDEGHMNVLIVAAPKDIVDSRIAACEAAGLEVEAVDVESFAMYRALIEAADAEQGETLAVVDVGANSTSVSVVHEGVFVMNRSIPHGGRMLTEALKGYFKLEDDDAEDGKSQLDVSELLGSGPIENPPLRVVQPHLDDLVREIRRSLNYFQSQQGEGSPGRTVSRLVLAGGGAKLLGIEQYLSQRLNVPVDLVGLYDNPRFTHSGPEEERGLDLAVASGLAMRSHAKAA